MRRSRRACLSIAMPKIDPYQTRAADYDSWFDRHPFVYEAELKAVRKFVPASGRGIEIGVGTGRFAGPLGIAVGIDPSPAMIKIAATRGIDLIEGTAENLPLRSAVCDYVMMITILHLLDDVPRAIEECHRVLIPGGKIIIGYVERDGRMAREYSRPSRNDDPDSYFRDVRFFSGDEVREILQRSGFRNPAFVQTIFRSVGDIIDTEAVEPGCGRGSFGVVRGEKPV
jgi:ubiquinone/menaquinone biosynthesis C-methylase UbiE